MYFQAELSTFQVAAAKGAGDPLRHRLRRHMVLADGRVQGVDVDVGQRRRHLVEDARRQLLHRQTLTPQLLLQVLATVGEGVLATLTREPLANLVGGSRRLDDLQPVTARSRPLDLRREDLAGVTGAERVVERHQPAVHPSADA